MGKSNNLDNQEIDLAAVGRGINRSMAKVNRFFYRSILFCKRKIVWILAIVIIGGTLGYLMDKAESLVYHNRIIVAPNFGSVDYLYAKIQLLKSKVRSQDEAFLRSIGITEPDAIVDIEVKPVVDVFKFVSNGTEQNYRLLELMAQDGDMNKIIVEPATAKNYPYHQISFTTRGNTSLSKTVEPILRYLNDSDFYRKVQKQYLENVRVKLAADDVIISQIDHFLDMSASPGEKNNDKLVYYNENTQLNDVIKTKDALIKEQGVFRVEMVGQDKIIKENTVTINVRDESLTNGNMKVTLPFILLLLFLLGYAFRSFYRSQSRKDKEI